MFLEALTPLMKEFSQQPIAFLGGFASGVFRLNLSDDPVKSWLEKQSGNTASQPTANSEKSEGPQSITIE